MLKKLIKKCFKITTVPGEIYEMRKTQAKILEKLDDISYRNDLFFYELYKKEGESIDEAKQRFLHSFKFENEYIKTIQNGNKILLENFVNICNKNKINYSLWVGSVLGAYVYKGFIPWDDDIDIAMPQEDFVKLQKIIENDSRFEIVEYIRTYCKDLIYKFVFKDHNCYYWLDLFIFSPTNMDFDKALSIKAHRRQVMVEKINKDHKTRKLMKNKLLDPNIYNRKGYPELFKYFEKPDCNPFFKKGLGNKIKGYICNVNMADMRVYEKELVSPVKTLKFENFDVSVPNKTEEFLKMKYGYLYNLPNNFQNHLHYLFEKRVMNIKEENEFLNKNK